MKKYSFNFIVLILFLSSCGPRISTTISKSYSPTDYREDIRIFGLQDAIPQKSEELGIIKIGDTGFSTKCGWDIVIESAKLEARKAGGNAIKIIEHKPPTAMGSTCHRITAKILKVEKFETIQTEKTDSNLLNVDYAVLKIYRQNPLGSAVKYNLYLGDSLICRVSNKWKTTINIKKIGHQTLWAKTEAKEELPIEIKQGKEYYIRCSVTMGAFIGRPKLELIDSDSGKTEFELVKQKKRN